MDLTIIVLTKNNLKELKSTLKSIEINCRDINILIVVTQILKKVIEAFQRHFRKDLVNGLLDLECSKIASNLETANFQMDHSVGNVRLLAWDPVRSQNGSIVPKLELQFRNQFKVSSVNFPSRRCFFFSHAQCVVR